MGKFPVHMSGGMAHRLSKDVFLVFLCLFVTVWVIPRIDSFPLNAFQ
jgi:hypothetical protein